MKATVLVIGQNVERQIIDLDPRNIVYDEQHRAYLDLKFDHHVLSALKSKRLFSQMGTIKRVLGLLDFQVILPASNHDFTTRLVLRADGQHKTIRIGMNDDYLWERPERPPQSVVLLESAMLSEAILEDVATYLNEFPQINLVLEYHYGWQRSTAGKKLLRRANLLWVDLLSLQTGETEDLLNCLTLDKQQLLINHQSGLSLSNSQRTYKLTNADYLELKPLEWLAIAIKLLNYDFDIEDSLELMARIGQSIARTSQVNIRHSITQLTHRSPEIELIRGEPNIAKTLTNKLRKWDKAQGIIIDLSSSNFKISSQLLSVRDLVHNSPAVILPMVHFKELKRRQPELLQQLSSQLLMVGALLLAAKTGDGRSAEKTILPHDIQTQLDQVQFYKLDAVQVSAEFLLGYSMPSNQVIVANTRQLAAIAQKTLSRALIPVIVIKTQAMANFDSRPGAVAAEFLRILQSLQCELQAHHITFDQVAISLQLPNLPGRVLDSALVKSWIHTIDNQLEQRNLRPPHVSFVADLALEALAQIASSEYRLICTNDNLSSLTEVPLTNELLRIRFSQFLVAI